MRLTIEQLKEQRIGLYRKEPHYNADEFTVAAQHFKEFGAYTNHPVNTSPKSKWYKFWVEEARRSVYGYNIGRDYIPGYFYWYLNYCPIEKAVPIEDADKESIFTLNENNLSYSDDDDIFGLTIPDEDDYDTFMAERVTSFPDYWDYDYKYFHYLNEAEINGEHAAVLKTRGRGYSYKGGSMLNRNFYLLPRSKSYAFANEKEYLISDGLLTKTWDMMGHIETHTPWGKRKARTDTMMHKKASYLKMHKGIQSELGFLSEIIGVSFKNNPDKARGKRGKLILWEESGVFPDLLRAWNIALSSMAQGRMVYGLMVAFGTGGTDTDDLLGLETLYSRGKGYKVYMIPNKIEPEMGYDKTGFFVGEQHNNEAAMDKNGNSLVDKAMGMIETDREQILKDSQNRESYLRYIAEKPTKPSEALLQIGSNMFPIDLLKQHKAYLLTHKSTWLDSTWIGDLMPNPETGEPEFKLAPTMSIIDHYPHDDIMDWSGAIAIYEPPIKNRDGIIPFGRYISGNDNYDHDDATTSSLGSTFILDRITERIVAEYTGRPITADRFYERNRMLLEYYNARQNFENNLRGLEQHMRKVRKDHLLVDTPEIIKDKVADARVLNRKKGTPGTAPIKKYGMQRILEWLLREVEKGTGIYNLHKIRSIALLDELIYWNSKGNFDRVDALIYLFILHEDMYHHIPDPEQTNKPKIHPFFAENPLFKQNMKDNNKIIMSTSNNKTLFKQ